jgi:hypothetical protein
MEHITAEVINRNWLRESWSYWMYMLNPDASFMVHETFDRYGCTKEEYHHHPRRRGSSAAGEEPNNENFLLIETVRVEPLCGVNSSVSRFRGTEKVGLNSSLARLFAPILMRHRSYID